MPLTSQPEGFHTLAAPDWVAMAAMKKQLEPLKGQVSGPGARPTFDEMMQHVPAAPGVRYEAATVGGVAGWWCRPAATTAPASAVLYLHGGAYVLGSASAYRNFVSQLVARAQVDFFVADYRLAPEHPFPAAVDDALAAYRGLVALGKHYLALGGDSVGGGLALVVAALATHEVATEPAAVAPRAAVVFSPWTDLALTSASMHTRAAGDFLLPQEALATNAAHYLHGHDAHDVRASPVYGNLAGLPPVQFHVGDAEVLLDDSVRYVDRARAAGVAAELHVWEGMTHVFASSVGTLNAAGQTLDMAGAFLAGQVG